MLSIELEHYLESQSQAEKVANTQLLAQIAEDKSGTYLTSAGELIIKCAGINVRPGGRKYILSGDIELVNPGNKRRIVMVSAKGFASHELGRGYALLVKKVAAPPLNDLFQSQTSSATRLDNILRRHPVLGM